MVPNTAKVARKVPIASREKAFLPEIAESGSLSDHEDITVKDETEKKLEKLLFGDDAGFVDSLRRGTTVHESLGPSTTGDDEEQHESDDDFEGVADQDVWSASTFGNSPAKMLTHFP